MLIYLLRHGLTEYNAQKRYQGQRDIPLSAEGLSQLRRADIDPKVVYITPLQRTAQTARVLFPEAELVVVKDLQEMCFGSFEGKNYVEMEHDADYQAWVQANCESKCPDGERKDDFSNRICNAFSALVDKALADGEELLVILAHGGGKSGRRSAITSGRSASSHWLAPPVQPLEIVGQPTPQVDAQGLRVRGKKGAPRRLNGPGAPQHMQHRVQVVQGTAHIGIHLRQQRRGHGIVAVQPGEIAPPMGARRQRDEQGAGDGR